MNEYQSLLWPEAAAITPGVKSKAPRLHMRGCEHCPQDGQPGIRKIKGTVEGKDIFVWAQSPGPKENEVGRELIGPSGKWFWDRMREVGIEREDCDIQNMVRCFPADKKGSRLVMRDPTKEEIFCCSLYTDQAIVRSRAKVHIVLGKVAAKQLFGARKFHAGNSVFWSDKMNGKVVVLDHPAYFIRRYAPEEKLRNFRVGLQAAARIAKEKAGKFSYLEAMDYEGITTANKARSVADEIRRAAKKGIRVSADLEDAKIEGRRVALCYGFSSRAGQARVFLLDHPGPNVTTSERRKIKREVISLLEDSNVRKSCHHGSYDKEQTEEIIGCAFRGYDFDTNYSEFFKYPGRRSYALGEIAAVRYPDFAGFKEVVMPEAAPKGMTYDQAYRAGKLDFGPVPWDKLVLRNAADADLTKRIEVSTKDVALPLLRVYMDAAFTLDKMEKNGPWFDFKQCDLLGKIYPDRIKRERQELQVIAGDPDFNPNHPLSVAKVLYGTLKLPIQGKNPNTSKDTLELLSHLHPFPKKVIQYRKDFKLDSTYRVGFKTCAEFHKGRLFTKWWLTGTKTGRISSGGSRDGEDVVTVNLQNIHGDPQVQNMLISDKRWREFYKAWKDESEHDPNWWKAFQDFVIYLILDYSQNELRFFAQSSGDPLLIEQFNSGEDIHCLVGHEITGWDVDIIKNNKEKRKLIKNFHFGLLYGLQPDGMLKYLQINGVETTLKKVTEMMARYFARYKRVKIFIKAMHEMAENKGYVENILGFRCPIYVTEGHEGGAFWKNQAVNTPIQGGAHQLLLMALASLKRKPVTYKLIRVPNMEIHDALVQSLKLRNLAEGTTLAIQLLEKEVLTVLQDDFKLKWKIPLVAEAKIGFRFGVSVDYAPDMDMGKVLSKWCQKNQESLRALYKEVQSVQGAAA